MDSRQLGWVEDRLNESGWECERKANSLRCVSDSLALNFRFTQRTSSVEWSGAQSDENFDWLRSSFGKNARDARFLLTRAAPMSVGNGFRDACRRAGDDMR